MTGLSIIQIGAPIPMTLIEQISPQAWDELSDLYRKDKEMMAHNTWRQWGASLRQFGKYAVFYQKNILPADNETAEGFVRYMADIGLKPGTLQNRVSSLAALHERIGYQGERNPFKSEAIIRVLKREKRIHGTDQKQAMPIRLTGTDQDGNIVLMEKLLDTCGSSLIDQRDAMVLRTGMFTGIRSSELVALSSGMIGRLDSGKGVVRIARSKSDQEGRGHLRHLPASYMKSLEVWLTRIADELCLARENVVLFPSFDAKAGSVIQNRQITAQDVSRIYKRRAKKAGYPDETIKEISAHSTRVGAAQELAIAGASKPEIMTALSWTSEASLMRYIAHLETENNATSRLLESLGY